MGWKPFKDTWKATKKVTRYYGATAAIPFMTKGAGQRAFGLTDRESKGFETYAKVERGMYAAVAAYGAYAYAAGGEGGAGKAGAGAGGGARTAGASAGEKGGLWAATKTAFTGAATGLGVAALRKGAQQAAPNIFNESPSAPAQRSPGGYPASGGATLTYEVGPSFMDTLGASPVLIYGGLGLGLALLILGITRR